MVKLHRRGVLIPNHPIQSIMQLRLLLLLSSLLMSLTIVAEQRYTGKIGDSYFIVDLPANATGEVLFLARGYRPNSLPLSAIYEKETQFFQTLLAEGWTIASPSFAGNRWIMADGAADLIALKKHVATNIIPVKRAYLYAETMGGGIAAWLAEHRANEFDGAISLGAHHYAEAQDNVPENAKVADYLPGEPGFPIVLLSNDGEVRSARLYAEKAADSAFPPVLWTVSRAGHVNLNSAERLAGLRAVIEWRESGTRPQNKSAMVTMQPESTAATDSGISAGYITRTRPLYGNIYTSFIANDMQQLGIERGDTFKLTHNNQTLIVTYATTYSDVPLGEWVAFIDPESYIQVSRNYKNATDTIGAVKGDALLLQTNY